VLSTVRTLLGDVSTAALGITDFRKHTISNVTSDVLAGVCRHARWRGSFGEDLPANFGSPRRLGDHEAG
jgi:hypothetical protein